MKSKIKLELFKDSGKYYDTIEYESEFPCHEANKLIEEAKTKFISDFDFTIEMEELNAPGHYAWNKYLVKNSKS